VYQLVKRLQQVVDRHPQQQVLQQLLQPQLLFRQLAQLLIRVRVMDVVISGVLRRYSFILSTQHYADLVIVMEVVDVRVLLLALLLILCQDTILTIAILVVRVVYWLELSQLKCPQELVEDQDLVGVLRQQHMHPQQLLLRQLRPQLQHLVQLQLVILQWVHVITSSALHREDGSCMQIVVLGDVSVQQ
jgi:hypothetical protein